MIDNKAYREISIVLDEWDPIGVNTPSEGVYYGEYSMYIDDIIVAFNNNCIYDYLILLYEKLADTPNEQGVVATEIATERITEILNEQLSS